MTGPEHYHEGEQLLAESVGYSSQVSPAERQALAVQAAAHFLAALTASHAASTHPESIAWEQAIDPKEQP